MLLELLSRQESNQWLLEIYECIGEEHFYRYIEVLQLS